LIAEIVRGGGAFYGMGISSGARAHIFAPSGGRHGSAAYGTSVLREGDILRLDAYGSVHGYLFDFARTRVVGMRPSREQRELIDAVRDSVTAGIEAIRPGETLGAVARRCDDVLAQSDYARRNGVPASTMGGAWGHGLGLAFEPPWIEPSSSVVIEEGMCLAVERRIEAPNAPLGLGGAQYEENVLVTGSGIELLSRAPTGFGE
jgi:Xaa-Pro aminopeptidase